MKILALLGASGHGKVMAEIAELMGYQRIIFFDDSWPKKSTVGKWPVVGNGEAMLGGDHHFDEYAVAIGDNVVRSQKCEVFAAQHFQAATLIHPSSVISQYSQIGEGSVFMAGSVVNIDSTVGLGCIINTGATVDHDCSIGDFSHISPNASLAGNVCIGERVWVGVGAAVKQSIQIASDVVIGAGAAVVSNIKESGIIVGVPAKPITLTR